MMLEHALRKLAFRLTGKPYEEIPRELEGIISFTAENLSEAMGDADKDGAGIVSITLTKDSGGKIAAGKWTDTKGKEHTILIEEDEA